MENRMERKVTDILVGGFGPLRHSACPGIEQLELGVEDGDGAGGDGDVTLRHVRLLADVPSPTWMEAVETPCGGRVLFAVLEDTNEMASFRIEGEGASLRLEPLSRVPTPGSITNHAAYVVDDMGHGRIVTTNYGDGHVCVHPVTDDGAILPAMKTLCGDGRGPLPAQEGPHAHWALPLPDGRLLTSDLGADRVYVHRWVRGDLMRVGAVALAPGTGPRDLHLLPVDGGAAADRCDWRVAVVGEWGGTVTLLGPDAGAPAGIAALQTVGLGPDALPRPDQAASLAFVPGLVPGVVSAPTPASGIAGMAYVGLRGSDRIVALSWDGRRLDRLAAPSEPGWRGRGVYCGGGRPRHILAVDGLLLVANETSDDVAVFRLAGDGEPTPVASLSSGAPTVFVRL